MTMSRKCPNRSHRRTNDAPAYRSYDLPTNNLYLTFIVSYLLHRPLYTNECRNKRKNPISKTYRQFDNSRETKGKN